MHVANILHCGTPSGLFIGVVLDGSQERLQKTERRLAKLLAAQQSHFVL